MKSVSLLHMKGIQRENPVECEIGDFVPVSDFEDSYGEEIKDGVMRMSLDGPDGKHWHFEMKDQPSPDTGEVVDVWIRTE